MTSRTSQAFVDESIQRGKYSLVGIVLPADELTQVRREVRALLLPGQSRLHMSKENPGRQRFLATRIASLDVQAFVTSRAHHRASERELRDECFDELVPVLLDARVVRLSIESCDQDRQDRVVVARTLAQARGSFSGGYVHFKPSTEPLLWIADIVAWAAGKGGNWAKIVEPVVTRTGRMVA